MQNTELLLKELTLEEKCALLSGAETFKTRGMPKHGIPQIWLSDGPHGLRKQAGGSDHLGLNPSVPATCFPTASAVANSWDAAQPWARKPLRRKCRWCWDRGLI